MASNATADNDRSLNTGVKHLVLKKNVGYRLLFPSAQHFNLVEFSLSFLFQHQIYSDQLDIWYFRPLVKMVFELRLCVTTGKP